MSTPIGAWADFEWNDQPGEVTHAYFSFGADLDDEVNENDEIIADAFGVPDDTIFFFCTGEDDMKRFMVPNYAEFTVLEYTVVVRE